MTKKVARRHRGRPATTGKGQLIGLRCHKPFLAAVDAWRAKQKIGLTRPAAIIRLAEIGLKAKGRERKDANDSDGTSFGYLVFWKRCELLSYRI